MMSSNTTPRLFSMVGMTPGFVAGPCGLVRRLLGYPTQARTRDQEARALARALVHPYSVTHALQWTAMLAQFCRDVETTQERTEAVIASPAGIF